MPGAVFNSRNEQVVSTTNHGRTGGLVTLQKNITTAGTPEQAAADVAIDVGVPVIVKAKPGNTYEKIKGRYIKIAITTKVKRTISGKVFQLGYPAIPVSGKTVVAYAYVNSTFWIGGGTKNLHATYPSNTASDQSGDYKITIPEADEDVKFDTVYLAVEDYESAGKFDPNVFNQIRLWFNGLNPKTGYKMPFTWRDKKPITDGDVGVEVSVASGAKWFLVTAGPVVCSILRGGAIIANFTIDNTGKLIAMGGGALILLPGDTLSFVVRTTAAAATVFDPNSAACTARHAT